MYPLFAPPVQQPASTRVLGVGTRVPCLTFRCATLLSVDLWEFVCKDLVNVFNPGVFQKDGHFEAIHKATK
jgi:hypothetical protein